jgi:hypothetical protein
MCVLTYYSSYFLAHMLRLTTHCSYDNTPPYTTKQHTKYSLWLKYSPLTITTQRMGGSPRTFQHITKTLSLFKKPYLNHQTSPSLPQRAHQQGGFLLRKKQNAFLVNYLDD